MFWMDSGSTTPQVASRREGWDKPPLLLHRVVKRVRLEVTKFVRRSLRSEQEFDELLGHPVLLNVARGHVNDETVVLKYMDLTLQIVVIFKVVDEAWISWVENPALTQDKELPREFASGSLQVGFHLPKEIQHAGLDPLVHL